MEQVISGCNMKCDNGDCALYYAELNNDNNELIYGFNCSDNPDCYYKQLKRLERQYEDVLKLAKENADSNEYCLKELEKENEFLKKELEKHKSKIGHLLSPLTDSDFQDKLKELEQECEEWGKLANEANERANDYANDIGKLQEDVRYYKELSKDFDTKLKLAHQDFTDFIQKQKLEISELKAECERLKDANAVVQLLDAEIGISNKYRTALEYIRDIAKKYDANASETIIANPIQDCYDIFVKINEVIGAEE